MWWYICLTKSCGKRILFDYGEGTRFLRNYFLWDMILWIKRLLKENFHRILVLQKSFENPTNQRICIGIWRIRILRISFDGGCLILGFFAKQSFALDFTKSFFESFTFFMMESNKLWYVQTHLGLEWVIMWFSYSYNFRILLINEAHNCSFDSKDFHRFLKD